LHRHRFGDSKRITAEYQYPQQVNCGPEQQVIMVRFDFQGTGIYTKIKRRDHYLRVVTILFVDTLKIQKKQEVKKIGGFEIRLPNGTVLVTNNPAQGKKVKFIVNGEWQEIEF
jgi:hypothetical protein